MSIFGNKYPLYMGWSGGVNVLGELLVPERPNFDNNRARAYCTCSKCVCVEGRGGRCWGNRC